METIFSFVIDFVKNVYYALVIFGGILAALILYGSAYLIHLRDDR